MIRHSAAVIASVRVQRHRPCDSRIFTGPDRVPTVRLQQTVCYGIVAMPANDRVKEPQSVNSVLKIVFRQRNRPEMWTPIHSLSETPNRSADKYRLNGILKCKLKIGFNFEKTSGLP